MDPIIYEARSVGMQSTNPGAASYMDLAIPQSLFGTSVAHYILFHPYGSHDLDRFQIPVVYHSFQCESSESEFACLNLDVSS